jgi:hypothetical protein
MALESSGRVSRSPVQSFNTPTWYNTA